MKLKDLKIRDTAGWTIFIFGLMASLLGMVTLIKPEWTFAILGLPILERTARVAGDYTLTFAIGVGIASFNIGVYYMLAAFNDMKMFYRWTVPFRCLTFTVFLIATLNGLTPKIWAGVGTWELLGALITAWALYTDDSKAPKSKKRKK